MGKEDLKRELSILTAKRKAQTVVRFNGVWLSQKEAEEYKTRFCEGCGKQKVNPKIYFGQEFCGDCVEKWSHGKR